MASRRDPLTPTMPPPAMTIVEFLNRMDACEEAVVWAQSFETLEQLWYACPRLEWMLWMLEQVGYDNPSGLRRLAVTCARRHEALLSDPRSRWALDVAEHAAGHPIGDEDLRAARDHGRSAAVDGAGRPEWSQARAAAATAAWVASRVVARDAARDASLFSLRACAWDPANRITRQEEEIWQTEVLRTLLKYDLALILDLARQKAVELAEPRTLTA